MRDVKEAASSLTNTRVSYLVLRDEAVGLDGLLPLEEDHVVERGEGQGL